MTLLELLFDVYVVDDLENDCKSYQYWTINRSEEIMLMNLKEKFDFFSEARRVPDKLNVLRYMDELCEMYYSSEEPVFIPYEELEFYERVKIEFDGKVFFQGCQKYPMICIRGTCAGNCQMGKFENYCLRGPCANKRPDMNAWTPRWPDFFMVMFDVLQWIKVCPGMDALVVYFDFTPNADNREFYYDSSYAFLIKNECIKVIGEAKRVRDIYKEYNRKYPTEDREIERAISSPEENFYFRF